MVSVITPRRDESLFTGSGIATTRFYEYIDRVSKESNKVEGIDSSISELTDRVQSNEQSIDSINLEIDSIKSDIVETNNNLSILRNDFDLFLSSLPFVFVSSQDDFDSQDDDSIFLLSNKIYVPSANFSISKKIIVNNSSSWDSFNPFGSMVTYTGTDPMFSGSNSSFFIANSLVSCPNASELFNFSDNSGQSIFSCNTVSIVGICNFGSFNGVGIIQINNVGNLSSLDGLSIQGQTTSLLTIDKFALTSLNPLFVGIDLGDSVITTIEIKDAIFSAPAGAYGINGLVDSGNVPFNSIAMVSGSSFLGGMSPTNGIVPNDDIRWIFDSSNPVPNTNEFMLSYFNSNSNETIITASSSDSTNAVIVNALWVFGSSSRFGFLTSGRFTSLSERVTRKSIDISIGLISEGGGAIDVSVYIFLNGSALIDTSKTVSISGTKQSVFPLFWEIDFLLNDYIEIFVENNTNTKNIIVESATLRIS